MVHPVNEKMIEVDEFLGETFGRRLKMLIKRRFHSQKEFARVVQVADQTVSRYVRDAQMPGGAEMLRIALAMPEDVLWLMTGVGSLPAPEKPSMADIRREGHMLIDTLPEFLVERLLWMAQGLVHYGQVGDSGMRRYERQVRGLKIEGRV